MSHPMSRSRVLVQLPNWLGDTVMSTPLLGVLVAAFEALPEYQRPDIYLALRRPWVPLFIEDPRLAGIIVVERRGAHQGLAGVWRLSRNMQTYRFDAVIVCPPSLGSAAAARLAQIPERIGYATDARGFLLTSALALGPRGGGHFAYEMIDLGLELLCRMGIEAPVVPRQGLPLASLPGCGGRGVAGERPLWVVGPGTTYGEAKMWPVDRVAGLVAAAVLEEGVRVVLLGDDQSAEFVAAIKKKVGLSWSTTLAGGAEIVDLTGRTDLSQVITILNSATAFVGNDSGLMHLAGALGVATVGVFGSSNPQWTHPLGRHTTALAATGFDCQPCYRKRCNQPRFCLDTVSGSQVMAEVRDLLRIMALSGEG